MHWGPLAGQVARPHSRHSTRSTGPSSCGLPHPLPPLRASRLALPLSCPLCWWKEPTPPLPKGGAAENAECWCWNRAGGECGGGVQCSKPEQLPSAWPPLSRPSPGGEERKAPTPMWSAPPLSLRGAQGVAVAPLLVCTDGAVCSPCRLAGDTPVLSDSAPEASDPSATEASYCLMAAICDTVAMRPQSAQQPGSMHTSRPTGGTLGWNHPSLEDLAASDERALQDIGSRCTFGATNARLALAARRHNMTC